MTTRRQTSEHNRTPKDGTGNARGPHNHATSMQSSRSGRAGMLVAVFEFRSR